MKTTTEQKNIIDIGRSNNLTGLKFGGLTVQKAWGYKKNRKLHWYCECECGNPAVVSGDLLNSGYVTSCGCRQIYVGQCMIDKGKKRQHEAKRLGTIGPNRQATKKKPTRRKPRKRKSEPSL